MSATHTYREAIENLYIDGHCTMMPKQMVHTIVMEQDPLGRVATKLRDGQDLKAEWRPWIAGGSYSNGREFTRDGVIANKLRLEIAEVEMRDLMESACSHLEIGDAQR